MPDMMPAPIQQPDITPVANPTRIRYTIPAVAEDPSFNDLANGLSKMDSGLSSFIDARQQQQEAVDKTAGEASFYANNSTGYAAGVANGTIPAQWSPAMVEGYKGAQGTLAGDTLGSQANAAWEATPDHDGTDPNAYKNFITNYMAKNIGTSDPDVLKTLMPKISQTISRGFEKDTQATSERMVQGYRDTQSQNVANAIDTATAQSIASGVPIPASIVTDAVGSSYVQAIKLGVPIPQAQQDAVLQIVTAAKTAALKNPQGNTSKEILAALDVPLPNGVMLSQTPYGTSQKLEALQNIQEQQNRFITQGREQEKVQDAKDLIRAKAAIIDFQMDPANKGVPVPNSLYGPAEKLDGGVRIQMLEWQKAINAEQPSDQRQLMDANTAILSGGGKAAWMTANDNGVYKNSKDYMEGWNLADKAEKGGGEAMKAIQDSPTYKTAVSTIKARTTSDKAGIMMGVEQRGDTDEGLGLKYEMDRQLFDWAAANPTASYQQQVQEISTLQAAALKNITTESSNGTAAIIAPNAISPGNPYAPPAGSAPTPGGLQPRPLPEAAQGTGPTIPIPPLASPGAPAAAPGPNFGGSAVTVKPQAAATGADPAAVQAWVASLPPDQQAKLQAAAQRTGQDPVAIATHAYTSQVALGAIPGAKPPPAAFQPAPESTAAAPQSSQEFHDAIAKWQATDPDAAAKIHQFTGVLTGLHAALPYQGALTVAAIKDNPQAAHLLDFVAGPESGGNYNAFYGHANSQADLSVLTMGQILQKQHDMVAVEGMPSSAIGRYQFMPQTLRGLMTAMNIPSTAKFTPELQDNMALQLLKQRGLQAWQQGKMSDTQFANNLAYEWASLPNVHTGSSQYAGDGLNKSLVTPGQVLGKLGEARGMPSMVNDNIAPPAISSPAGATTPSAPVAPAQAIQANQAVYYGDSIAHIARNAAGPAAQGVTTDGRSPADIYKDIAADHTALQGKTVVLSSASNNVNDLASTQKSINLLISRGVKPADIKLVGVGDFKAAKDAGLNDKLAALAKSTGATFTGPLDTNNLRPDRVHPANGSQFLAKVLGQQQQVATQ